MAPELGYSPPTEHSRELQAPVPAHEERIRPIYLKGQQDQDGRIAISAESRAFLRSVKRHQYLQQVEEASTFLVELYVAESLEPLIKAVAAESLQDVQHAERVEAVRNRPRLHNAPGSVPDWWLSRRSLHEVEGAWDWQ